MTNLHRSVLTALFVFGITTFAQAQQSEEELAKKTEATYDWKGRQWSVPLKASVAKLTKIGGQEVNVEGGVHYWIDSPESGPRGWGWSFAITVLLPK